MRILFVGINFWPEPTGTGKYSGEMVHYLQNAGHEVTVITAPPYYPHWKVQLSYRSWCYKEEFWNGIRIIRCPLYVPKKVTGLTRLVHLLSFVLTSMPVIVYQMCRQPDLFFDVAPTLFTANVASYALKRNRSRNWLHIQDFELDAALELGLIRRLPLVERLARAWERSVYRRFGSLSTISHAMVEKLKTKGVSEDRIVYFPNWIDPSHVFPLTGENSYRSLLGLLHGDIVLLYSGSIGQKQGLENLIDVMRLLKNEKSIHLLICGEGPGKAGLQEAAADIKNVHFLPVQPAEKLNELLNLADIHTLPQKAGAADLVMPSKLLGMLASGKPVIAACPAGSELYNVVSDCGLVVPPENPVKFAEAVKKLAEDKGLRERLGSRGRERVMADYSSENVLKEVERRLVAVAHPVSRAG